MRPRQSSLGIHEGNDMDRQTVVRFNEAEAIKPRNRDVLRTWAMAQDTTSFNEAEAIKPRNRDQTWRHSLCSYHDTLASMRPRQSSLGILKVMYPHDRWQTEGLRASMRPRQSSLGIPPEATGIHGKARTRFNEAEAIKPRNQRMTGWIPAWWAVPAASMRPRQSSLGILACQLRDRETTLKRSLLQ